MRVWLDDERGMPTDYDVHVMSAKHAITILKTGAVTAIALDHDLGFGSEGGRGTGMEVTDFIEFAAFHGGIKRLEWTVHTDNAAAKPRMEAALKNADKYWAKAEAKRA